MCCIYGNIYDILCVICIYMCIHLAIKYSLLLFWIAPIYVDVIVLVTFFSVVLSSRLVSSHCPFWY